MSTRYDSPPSVRRDRSNEAVAAGIAHGWKGALAAPLFRSPHQLRASAQRASRRSRAFTLVEVMIASLVLVFGIVSAISAMQSGVRAMDRTRKLALATQVLQTEMEQLRLKSWTQLDALAGTSTFTPDSTASGASAFTCTRRITSPKSDMREITLTAEWRGSDGRPQAAKLITRYGKNGLNDYISTAH
ncbi:MAG TPA: type II secretion system protein [Acidobacteriota bacterium]|nr:type II secretion system protein [Acidobacteriota bacterium]